MTPREAAKAISDLRKSGRLEEALAAGRVAWKEWHDEHDVRRAVGWCLWERVKARLSGSLDGVGWTETVRDLTCLSTWALAAAEAGRYGQYDAFPLTVITVMRAAGKARQPGKVLEAAALADPSMLSTSRSGDFPSARMEWLFHATSALTEQRDWTSLLELESKELLPGGEEEQAQWVRYRFALAHEGRGDHAGALAVFDQQFRTMDSPWKRVVRARLLQGLGRVEEAVEEARRALADTKDADLLLSIDALHVVARVLAGPDRERAVAHAAIATAIREEKGYLPDTKMRATLAALGVPSVAPASGEVRREQVAWWKAAAESARLLGTVARHLAHGGAGFITGSDGKSYYFSKKRDDPRPLLPIGTRVSFEMITSFDERKQAPSTKAIKVRKA